MIVIVGLGTGGLYTAKWISSVNRDEEITIIERRKYDTYSPCSIPMVVEGKISENDIVHPFPKSRKIRVLTGHEAIKIDVGAKKIVVKNVDSGQEMEIAYDKLIYAAGARPWVPPIEGIDKKGVFTVRVVEDAVAIKNWAENSKRALVVGAGAIGVEMAYALRARGLEVTLIEMLPHAFPNALDKDMAKYVDSYLKEKGIKTMYGVKLEKIIGAERVSGAVVNGAEMNVDMIIMSTGVRPETALLKGVVDIDERGFIVVNERMETSVPDIYAIGDCVRTPHGVIQLATTAMKQAAVAGINAAGGNAIYTRPTGAFVSAFGGYEVASVGTKGEIAGRGWSRINPYSEEKIIMKIFIDRAGKLLGAQAVGPGAASRINVVSALLRKGAHITDLMFMEQAYCPEVCELYDVLNIAAENAVRRVKMKIDKYEV
ncbi:MAG: FAD-dependent oxidoreductase [Euryarchaeota archaeon]|nr:FAD-dependent oxidoreductase [Euryarchaeota archaeon]